MITRRKALIGGVSSIVGGGLLLRAGATRAQTAPHVAPDPLAPAAHVGGHVPVVTPGGSTMPFRTVNGVKVFHLVAESVHHVITPGLEIEAWGYNGSTPGPTIEVVEGDRVRIYVTNRLPEPTTVHWHGVFVPNGMDGVAGLTQRAITPGTTVRYEFTLQNAGTFMYHPHYDEMTQMALGMMGMFIVHPRRPRAPAVDRDYAIMLSEWSIPPGARRPNPLAMNDFNVLTMNSKSFPSTVPLFARVGERVRIRLGNLGAMDHHPIHIHGHAFRLTATDGGPISEASQWPETTVLVPVGSTRDVEFVAERPGDWPLHCHMTHHVMTQMGHEASNTTGVDSARVDRALQRVLPDAMTMGANGMGDMAEMEMPAPTNSVPMRGAPGPFGTIDMGGMFTIVKIRGPHDTGADGWYRHPEGTVAREATETELRADGIDVTVQGGGHTQP
jgi:FtsP/CotA-like multicopper oxidase with cupredoxin domain